MKRKFGIGIIGCGIIAKRHIEACRLLHDWCEIKAVSDIDLEKAEEAAALAGAQADIYADYRDMLSREDIDVIALCTPPFFHKEPAIEAFRMGKHVLCEKPLAPSLQDCDEMLEAAREHRCKLATVFQLRFLPDIQKMKHIMSSGMMGPVVFAQMSGNYWRGSNYYDVPWRGKFETESGGVTMNHSIHTLDLFLWLMDTPLASVQAEMDTLNHDIEVEDLSLAMFRFQSGAAAQVSCSLNTVKEGHAMSFSSDRHYVSYPYFVHAVRQTEQGGAKMDAEEVRRLESVAAKAKPQLDMPKPSHCDCYYDLFQSIVYDEEPSVSGLEGRRTIEAITAIYKSATLGRKVELPIVAGDPWYTTEGIIANVKKSGRGASRHEH
ncbi:Gfo/Idh/MocA family oxidoreductase [Paenibacillus sp. J5C_2022]|uniref:Gfo/Idh/MocA family protein n=1 Tax=Paenibacillus sp. J5C2022 TaxID=2977129 RepID=UPI0021CE7076|nr:Gfo/Idh/MocA family oxidoreductase [Paenibacillus sp. J5C2022]MCU6707849.1 Gfo/Idh/MocA family oxidoreductase [Paenibacillus sp. J5C2022]